ncbi:MAG: DUF167 domain-containing protein [Patescibacteria group bacterium]
MIIKITAHANNKKDLVESDMFDLLHVYTKARPQEGEANMAIVELLARHFKVSKSCVVLKHGGTGKVKTFEIFGM